MKITDVVFTNHAIERIRQRGISGDWIWQTVKQPETKMAGKEKHTTEFTKRFIDHTVTAVAKKNDIGEWVVLSAWVDPPFAGTEDYHKKEAYLKKQNKMREFSRRMEKASFWGKMWLAFRKQAGL